MREPLFTRLLHAGSRNRLVLLVAVVLSIGAGLAGLFFIRFESNIELMLPDHPVVRDHLAFLNKSRLSGKLVLWLELAPEGQSTELHSAVDQVAAALDPVLFPKVITGLSGKDLQENMGALLDYLPSVMSPEDLHKLAAGLDRKEVSQKLRQTWLQFLNPGSLFMRQTLQADPLGFSSVLLGKLQEAVSSLAFDVEIENGHFVTRDRRNAMLIVETPVRVPDTQGSGRVVGELKRVFSLLPATVKGHIIGGHTHTVSNEEVIRRDIGLTLVIAAVAFFLLFAVLIADVATLLIYLVPAVSVVFGVNAAYLMLGPLSYSVIGVSAVVAGISVDYGIHVYIAARTTGNPLTGTAHVVRPVTAGAATTLGIFAAFFLSRIEGYHQMAVFTILSILVALVMSLLVLPHALGSHKGRLRFFSGGRKTPPRPGRREGWILFLWLVLTVALAWSAWGVRLESDIRKIDGASPEILAAEDRFDEVWKRQKLAILVAESGSLEQALALNRKIRDAMQEHPRLGPLTSVASLLPEAAVRKANRAAWSRFWSPERRIRLETLVREESHPFGFSDDAFRPFFQRLNHTDTAADADPFSVFPEMFLDRFLQKTDDTVQVLSYVPDSAENLAELKQTLDGIPGVRIVSAQALSSVISSVITEDMVSMTRAALLFLVLLTFIFVRNVKESILALIPVLSSVVWLFGIMALLKLPLNVANLVADVVVMGLCIDYGIFMVFSSRHRSDAGTTLAVSLSALTTLIGAGVLVFAKHPALFSIGVTIVIGIGAGFLSAVFVVPAAYRRLLQGPEGARPS